MKKTKTIVITILIMISFVISIINADAASSTPASFTKTISKSSSALISPDLVSTYGLEWKYAVITYTSVTSGSKIAVEWLAYTTNPIGPGNPISFGTSTNVNISNNYTWAILPHSGMSCPAGINYCHGVGLTMTNTKIAYLPYVTWNAKIYNKGSSSITVNGNIVLYS